MQALELPPLGERSELKSSDMALGLISDYQIHLKNLFCLALKEISALWINTHEFGPSLYWVMVRFSKVHDNMLSVHWIFVTMLRTWFDNHIDKLCKLWVSSLYKQVNACKWSTKYTVQECSLLRWGLSFTVASMALIYLLFIRLWFIWFMEAFPTWYIVDTHWWFSESSHRQKDYDKWYVNIDFHVHQVTTITHTLTSLRMWSMW